MKFSNTVIIAMLALCLFSACGGGYTKGKAGMEYKIISNGKGKKVKLGEVVKLHFSRYYKDSLLVNSRDQLPSYSMVDSTSLPAEWLQIFIKARVGDSIVARVLTDSVFKNGQEMPPAFKKGQYLITRFKVLGVFPAQQAQEDMSKEMTAFRRADSIKAIAQRGKDDAAIQQYLAKNNIQAQKMEGGTYVKVDNPGTGPTAGPGKMISVKYTGRLFSGKAFDSNVDTSFHHTEPIEFVIGTGGIIAGWEDGLKAFGKGGKGVLFVPSTLAYGSRGREPEIKPNENLIFDVEVLDVKDPPAENGQQMMPPRARPQSGGAQPGGGR